MIWKRKRKWHFGGPTSEDEAALKKQLHEMAEREKAMMDCDEQWRSLRKDIYQRCCISEMAHQLVQVSGLDSSWLREWARLIREIADHLDKEVKP